MPYMALHTDDNDVNFNFGEWLNLPIIEDSLSDPNHSWPSEATLTVDPCGIEGFLATDEVPELFNGITLIDSHLTTVSDEQSITQDLDYSQLSQLIQSYTPDLTGSELSVPSLADNISHPTPLPELFLTSESRWQAVVNRTPDAPFVYAVLSTGIYCRATCPSRRPLRNNVKFYDTGTEAAQAGFRPCKRCKPDDAAGEAAEQRQAAAVEKAKRLIEEASRNREKIPLDKLAGEAGLSTFYFHRVFKKRVGVTPEEWGKRCRQQASGASLRS